jgi:hypothetical protein
MGLTVPTPESVATFAAAGFTRYSHAQIAAAIEAYEASVVAFDAAAQRAFALVEANAPHGTHWVAWWSMLEQPWSALYDAICAEEITYCNGAHRSNSAKEQWPVKTWLAAASKNRAAVRRLERAIKRAHE